MSGFIITRELIKRIYTKYDAYINPLLKFIFALIILSVVNSKIGYMDRLDNIAIVLIAALLCSFMPTQVIALMTGVFMILHMYALALECALVFGVLFFLMFILYVRLVPKETMVVLITPVLYLLKIPYVMPVAVGLFGGPMSFVSLAFGVVLACFIEYVHNNATTLTSMEDGNIVGRITFVVDGLLGNRAMLAMIIVFSIVLLLVYVLRRRAIDYSWTLAVIAGSIAELVLFLICDIALNLNYSLGGIIFGSILAAGVGLFLQLFSFHLDYKRVENVQFEDDDYYYYVRAVPKVKMSATDRKVKKVQPSQSRQASRSTHSSQADRAVRHSETRSTASTARSIKTEQNAGATPAKDSQRTVHTANGASRTINR
ncbi:MAG: hypothetical protein K6E68_03760 [Lachnospiraceae bacterium]|nr:hypothetical protein [Lachnospiraceae bacterium]